MTTEHGATERLREHTQWHASGCPTCEALDPLLVALNDIDHIDAMERDLIVRIAGGAIDEAVREGRAVREAEAAPAPDLLALREFMEELQPVVPMGYAPTPKENFDAGFGWALDAIYDFIEGKDTKWVPRRPPAPDLIAAVEALRSMKVETRTPVDSAFNAGLESAAVWLEGSLSTSREAGLDAERLRRAAHNVWPAYESAGSSEGDTSSVDHSIDALLTEYARLASATDD